MLRGGTIDVQGGLLVAGTDSLGGLFILALTVWEDHSRYGWSGGPSVAQQTNGAPVEGALAASTASIISLWTC